MTYKIGDKVTAWEPGAGGIALGSLPFSGTILEFGENGNTVKLFLDEAFRGQKEQWFDTKDLKDKRVP